jgi:GNAT superfamily N-acetyltransferase
MRRWVLPRICQDDLKLTGYYPGVIGKVTELHAVYYFENWDFDTSFEAQVGKELSEFMVAFRPERDGFWAARVAGEFAGAIAIDGSRAVVEGARLRWFIVAPRYQGHGVGGELMGEAIRFCRDAGHKRVYLWTFKGLNVARALYEREGFRLILEHPVDQWGSSILEQKWEWVQNP